MTDAYTIAIYVRVSLEDQDLKLDDSKKESNSLGNQRKLLHSYIESHQELAGKRIIEFSDDGFTGRNFERPDFQRMIEAVRAGHIQCVVTKDFSRLGRDYIEVGDYLEHIFPFLGVRYIAINDGYDSANIDGATPGLDFAFKNLVYDLYSRDLSQKVKSSIQTLMKKGQYISGFGLYGYKKSDDQTVPLIIDEAAAKVVRDIFDLAAAGDSSQVIARKLNQGKVMTPAMYRRNQGNIVFRHSVEKTPIWSTAAVVRILRDKRYLGNMIYYKRLKSKVNQKSFVLNPEENQIRVENTHEAIVTEELFQKANASLRVQTARVGATRKKMTVFFCPHCGHRLRESRGKIKHYYCYSARMYATEECKNVIIDKDYIEGLVLELIRNQARHLMEEQEKAKSRQSARITDNSRDIQQLEGRKKYLEQDNIRLYKKYREGTYSKEDFVQAKARRLQELQEINERIEQLCEKEKLEVKKSSNLDEAVNRLRPYQEINVYDKNIVAEIIKKVVVKSVDQVEVT